MVVAERGDGERGKKRCLLTLACEGRRKRETKELETGW
jgi:hypothetical protein